MSDSDKDKRKNSDSAKSNKSNDAGKNDAARKSSPSTNLKTVANAVKPWIQLPPTKVTRFSIKPKADAIGIITITL